MRYRIFVRHYFARHFCRATHQNVMATRSSKPEKTDSKDEVAPRARLHKLVISNFRAIGTKAVSIELDDIVVLVGPNNAGKSSILRAYEVVMQSGKLNELTIEDFPNAKVPGETESHLFPTIELETVLFQDSNPPAEHWIHTAANGDRHVRERWIWKNIGKPEKRGYDVKQQKWDENHGPWGLASVAQTNRPETHRIEAFTDPTKQADEILTLLTEAIKEKIKEISARKAKETTEKSDYEKLLQSVGELQTQVAKDAAQAIDALKTKLNTAISDVFSGYSITLDARPEEDLARAISFFKSQPLLRMGPTDGHQSTLENQGSGARRTLLWTALRILAEHRQIEKGVTERPHVLLLDEPEMCLHPSAIRDACNVLYSLPAGGKWQVMVTTHSPVFIDLARDNTSIIRVERQSDGAVSGTTIFRPGTAKLSTDDKQQLKLLNMYDPYVAEFFFGGKTIVVEGDTEHSAFREIINSNPTRYNNVHVIRARGKYTIVALCKILNHFGSPYAVLHDADRKTIKTKKGLRPNSAWAANEQILNTVSNNTRVKLVASIPNFEEGLFGEAADGEKPFGAWEKVRNDQTIRGEVGKLLDFLTSDSQTLPSGSLQWNSISSLESAIQPFNAT